MLSRNIVALQVETQCCESAEFYTHWSIVCNWRWFLLSDNLAFRQTFASTSGRHFLLNFPFQRSSLRMKLSSVSDSYAKSCIFATVFPSLLTFFLLVLKNQTKCSKAYDSHRGVCTERIYDFSFRELLVYWNLGCLQGPPCFFFYLPCCWASRKPITSVEFKFVARQVETSVVIRAAKP